MSGWVGGEGIIFPSTKWGENGWVAAPIPPAGEKEKDGRAPFHQWCWRKDIWEPITSISNHIDTLSPDAM